VPSDGVWGGIAIKLGPDVHEVLDGGDVDIIDGREIEDDGSQDGLVSRKVDLLTATRARIIPWTVLWGVVLVKQSAYTWVMSDLLQVLHKH
jgi:hypothetical protein